MQPSIGRIVHYVARGSADGKYPKTCRAAIVTEVTEHPDVDQTAGLCVLNPSGQFFHSLAEGGCAADFGEAPAGGTWHWPERA